MFADDTKFISDIRPKFEYQDRSKLQTDIDTISEWCKRWHISLNTTKCTVMHIGRSNIGADYSIEDSAGTRTTLAVLSGKRDLGVEISEYLRPYNQVCKVASTVIIALGLLRNTLVSR